MLKSIAIRLIQFYQDYIRIILPSACRFSPTCSKYTREAIVKYGFASGLLKGLKRLSSCHPFSKKSGDDPLV